jgi:hypothetical protein
MNLHRCQLGGVVFKAVEDVTLWQTEKGVIKIRRGTLGLPIELDRQHIGYVLHGHGKLTLDAIVETEEGAIGKPVEKEILSPFLMLGKVDALQQSFDKADREDVKKVGHEDEQVFLKEAEELFDKFLGRRRFCDCGSFETGRGFIFAIPDETGRFDILLAKDSRIVYKAAEIAFISSSGKTILKNHGSVALSHNGKSFIVKNRTP